LAGKSFATVAKAVATLKDLAVAQLARMEGARARRDARDALVETLQRISRTTRVIQADDLTFPITCRLPAGESAQAVLTAARLFARGLEAVAASFIAYGMDDTFVADPHIAAREVRTGPPPPRRQQARKRGYARNPRLDDRRSHDRSAPTGRYRRQSAVRGPCGHCRVGVRPPFVLHATRHQGGECQRDDAGRISAACGRAETGGGAAGSRADDDAAGADRRGGVSWLREVC